MADFLAQVALFSTDPSAQAAIQICSDQKMVMIAFCQNCTLQRHDNLSLDNSVLLLEPSLHDLAISLAAQPAATSVLEEQVCSIKMDMFETLRFAICTTMQANHAFIACSSLQEISLLCTRCSALLKHASLAGYVVIRNAKLSTYVCVAIF